MNEDVIEIENSLHSGCFFYLTDMFFEEVLRDHGHLTLARDVLTMDGSIQSRYKGIFYSVPFQPEYKPMIGGSRYKTFMENIFKKMKYRVVDSRVITGEDLRPSILNIEELLDILRVNMDGYESGFYRGNVGEKISITENTIVYSSFIVQGDYLSGHLEDPNVDFLIVRELLFFYLLGSTNLCLLRMKEPMEENESKSEVFLDVEDIFSVMTPSKNMVKVYRAIVKELFKINSYLLDIMGSENLYYLDKNMPDYDLLNLMSLRVDR